MDTNLALSNGLNPAGAILSSMNVRKKTDVARSFHGRPGSRVDDRKSNDRLQIPNFRTKKALLLCNRRRIGIW